MRLMRTTVVFAALLLAACAGDGQTVQPVLSTNKVVYAHACPQPEKLSALVCGQADPGGVRKRVAVPMGGSREVWAPVPAAGLPNTQHPTLG